MPQESEKKDVMKYKNDFMFLSDVMSNGDGIVQNGAVGEITFESGEIGRSGYGLRHIIEQRYSKDGKNVDEITALIALVKDVSEHGKIVRENGRNIELQTDNGIVSIVRKESDDKPYKWVLTGFDDFGNKSAATDAIQTVIARYSYLPEYSSFRTQVGTVIASVERISQTTEMSSIEPQAQESEKRNLALENIQEKQTMPENTEHTAFITKDTATRIALAREIRANMPDLTDGERAAALAIIEAGAASMQMSLSDYVQNTFPNGVFGDFSTAQNAAHQQGVEINGAVSVHGFGDSVRATIYASKTADFSTFVHELSHVWQAQLRDKLKNDAEKAFQVQNGDWKGSTYTFADGHTDTSAEAFAYGFEDFLKKKAGEMATEDKKAIFEKFADYMARTYNGTKQNIEMSEDIAKVYEQFVQMDDNILAEAEKAVRMEREFASAVALAESEPIEITHNRLQDITDLKELRVNAREEYKKLGSAITKDGRNVQFSTAGYKEIQSHSAERILLDVIPQLKTLTENAEYLFSEKAENATKSDALYFHSYGIKIKVGDEENLLRLSIRETKNHDYFYDAHNSKVETIKKGLSSSNIDRIANPADADKSLSKDKLYHWLKSVKENDSENRIQKMIQKIEFNSSPPTTAAARASTASTRCSTAFRARAAWRSAGGRT